MPATKSKSATKSESPRKAKPTGGGGEDNALPTSAELQARLNKALAAHDKLGWGYGPAHEKKVQAANAELASLRAQIETAQLRELPESTAIVLKFQERMIPLKAIRITGNHRDTVKTDDPETIRLARTLTLVGLQQRIGVRDCGDGTYETIFGARRFTAATVNRWEEIPAKVYPKETTAAQVEILRTIENFGRKDLTPVERAIAVARTIDAIESTLRPLSDRAESQKFATDGKLGSDFIEWANTLDPEKVFKGEPKLIEAVRLQRQIAAAGDLHAFVGQQLGFPAKWVKDNDYVSKLGGRARALLSAHRIDIGHARELAKLGGPIAADAIAAMCARNESGQGGRSVEDCRKMVTETLRSLRTVPWRLDVAFGKDKPGCTGQACETCKFNSKSDPDLFGGALADEPAAGFCTNPTCFAAKQSIAEKDQVKLVPLVVKKAAKSDNPVTESTIGGFAQIPIYLKPATVVRKVRKEIDAQKPNSCEPASSGTSKKSLQDIAQEKHEQALAEWESKAHGLLIKASKQDADRMRLVLLLGASGVLPQMWGSNDPVRVLAGRETIKLALMDAGNTIIERSMKGENQDPDLFDDLRAEWIEPFVEPWSLKLPPMPKLEDFLPKSKNAAASAANEAPPDAAGVDWVARMKACETASEARELFCEHEDAIHDLMTAHGLDPLCGDISDTNRTGFSIVNKNKWKSAVAKLKKETESAADELQRLTDQGREIHGEMWEDLLNAEALSGDGDDDHDPDDTPPAPKKRKPKPSNSTKGADGGAVTGVASSAGNGARKRLLQSDAQICTANEASIGLHGREELYSVAETGLKPADFEHSNACSDMKPRKVGRGKNKRWQPGFIPKILRIKGTPYYCFGESCDGDGRETFSLGRLYSIEEWAPLPSSTDYASYLNPTGGQIVNTTDGQMIIGPDSDHIEVETTSVSVAPANSHLKPTQINLLSHVRLISLPAGPVGAIDTFERLGDKVTSVTVKWDDDTRSDHRLDHLALVACRVCGCTDADCRGCIERTGEPCSWTEPDLCSACYPIINFNWDEAGRPELETYIEQLTEVIDHGPAGNLRAVAIRQRPRARNALKVTDPPEDEKVGPGDLGRGPKAKHYNFDEDVADVLRRAKTSHFELSGAQWIQLPPEQLERKLYDKVNKAIELLGGKWNKHNKLHLFPAGVKSRELLDSALAKGSVVDRKATFQFFETPSAVVSLLIGLAALAPGCTVLEPSAGRGAIADAVRAACPSAHIHVVELQPELQDELRKKGYEPHCGDFLQVTTNLQYDRIIMNPPFTRRQDVEHVRHALKLLKPGGILVSVMSAGVQTAQDKTTEALLNELPSQYTLTDLPSGSFKASGTSVSTCVLVAHAPAASAAVPFTEEEEILSPMALSTSASAVADAFAFGHLLPTRDEDRITHAAVDVLVHNAAPYICLASRVVRAREAWVLYRLQPITEWRQPTFSGSAGAKRAAAGNFHGIVVRDGRTGLRYAIDAVAPQLLVAAAESGSKAKAGAA